MMSPEFGRGVYSFDYFMAGSEIATAKVTDPKGNATAYRFRNFYPVSITDPYGQVMYFERDYATNNLMSVTDVLGRITRYTYDQNGNTTSIVDPAGNTTIIEYDQNLNKPISIMDALGDVTEIGYDSKGNLTSIEDPLENTTSIAYNRYGQPVSVTDALSHTTTFEYDEYGNLVKATDPLGNSAFMRYDIISRLLDSTDPKGRTTSYTYDLMNRITEVTDAQNGITEFTYDANGNLTSVTDAKGQTISYAYNLRDKVASMTDQLGRNESYSYDMNDNLISVADRKGQTTTYTYDKENQINRVDYADGSYTTYTYDAVGKLTYINDSISGPIQYVYSNTGCGAGCSGAVDKVIQEITPLGSISYEYDALGRRTGMTVAGQPAVNYTYDGNSRLTEIDTMINAVAVSFNLSYDALGRRTSLTLPNGVTTNYTYDNASHLLELKHLSPLSSVLDALSYVYDPNGNRTSMNRPSVNLPLPSSVSNTSYNQANQVMSFKDKNMIYDNNGNMLSVTNSCGTTTYDWDVRNRLVGIDGYKPDCSPLTATFKYNALGRRIEKTINGKTMQYLYDGLDIIQEIENGVVSVNYIRTLNIDELLARLTPNVSRYYQTDALGSIIALTDDTGAIKTQYTYDPFGHATMSSEASDNPFQYTGRENDNTGLYYYRARYYSTELQRFISEDPIGFAGGDVNLYRYVGNNPQIFIDPFGLAPPQHSYGGANMCQNIKEAKIMGQLMNPLLPMPVRQLGLIAFVGSVWPGSRWDYKRWGPYEDFGNYNFGMVAAAAGFSEFTTKLGAGLFQAGSDIYTYYKIRYGWNTFFDEPKDQYWITEGYRDYESMKNKCECQ
jgi:RHS repeat-associated protein